MRNLYRLLCSVFFASILVAQDLPVAGNPDRLGFEPDLTLTGPPNNEPDAAAAATAAGPPAPTADLTKLQASLERAKRTAASFERLFKAGAAAKIEAERSAMKVIVITKDIAVAKAALAKTDLEQLKAKAESGDGAAAALKAAEEAVTAAEADAQRELATCAKAQLEAAQLNLFRWQKLLTVGAARKVDVTRAQEQLAALQRSQTQAPTP